MKIYLLRHGKTTGNLEGRYVGTTDEPLCAQGVRELETKTTALSVQAVFVSPMLRCRQSAELLFPQTEQIVVENLRECDFGDFEYRNYRELSDDPRYQQWIDSGGALAFPNGERPQDFRARCCGAFLEMLDTAQKRGLQEIACVAHGGTIMSVMERFAVPKRSYFEYQVKNGCGYAVNCQTQKKTAVRAKRAAVLTEEQNTEHMVEVVLSVCYDIA